jgi:hypothetical protein
MFAKTKNRGAYGDFKKSGNLNQGRRHRVPALVNMFTKMGNIGALHG